MRIPYKKAIGHEVKPGRSPFGKKPGKLELKKLYIKETRSIRELLKACITKNNKNTELNKKKLKRK